MTAAPSPMWVTNSPEAARKLKAADLAYRRAVARTGAMRLAEKIDAMRAARVARDAAYEAVFLGAGNQEAT